MTVFFSDVVGWTSVAERLDPEVLREVMKRYLAQMVVAIEQHGGTVEKFVGDEVMAVFGVPSVHEDDALRAVHAAVAVRRQLAELNAELELERGVRFGVRIGINTGEVMTGPSRPGEPLVTGYAVNVGKRIEQAAGAGEVLLGPTTMALVRDAVVAEPAGPIDLRGRARPLPAFRFLGLRPEAGPAGRNLQAPLVGRREELGRLRAAFDEAAGEGSCRIATVVGDAGIGKSRLGVELARSASTEAEVLHGRCVPYGEGATYLPLRDIVTAAVGPPSIAKLAEVVAGDERAALVARRLAELVGLAEGPGSSGEAFWATRRFLTRLAERSPLLLCPRGPALGRADVPRPRRVPRRRQLGRARLHRLHGTARAAGRAPGLAGSRSFGSDRWRRANPGS